MERRKLMEKRRFSRGRDKSLHMLEDITNLTCSYCELTLSLQSCLQFSEQRFLHRPHIQLLRPRAPWLRVQEPVCVRQISGLHKITLKISHLLFLSSSFPLPFHHATNELAIDRTINDNVDSVDALALILARNDLAQ